MSDGVVGSADAPRTGDEAAADAQGGGPPTERRWLPRWRLRNAVRLSRRALQSFGERRTPTSRAETQRLQRAERRGLQLAILCRTAVFGVALVWYVGSLLASGYFPNPLGLGILALLTGLGVAHFIIIGTRHDRPALKYVMVTVDMAALSSLFALVPVSFSSDVPQIYAYRGFGAVVLVPFVALATLSLSPRLVVWAGVSAGVCFLGAFAFVVAAMDNPVSWSDIPVDADRETYEAVFLSPDFIGSGTRMTETIILVLSSLILALAVVGARRVFFAQIEAEAAREAEREARAEITRRLGRFVPAEVAERILHDPKALAPKVREGTALVMDIANFTAFAEHRDPHEVIGELNAFLARCSDAVSEEGGVVITFMGDGLLATFNLPLEVPDAAAASVAAARALIECGKAHGFALRVGLAAGPIAAGSVGSAERQAFTVYGDTVNRAARLEALAKTLHAPILADGVIASRVAGMAERGAHTLQGFSEPVAVWSCSTGPTPTVH